MGRKIPRACAVLLPFLVSLGSEARAVEPRVIAAIIGVGNYPDRPVPAVVGNAKAFARAIAATYNNADVREYYNDDASQEVIRKVLFGALVDAPPQSLLIIFFTGHCERPQESDRDLFLLLHKARQHDFFGASIRARDIVDALARTRRTAAMVFLDCCQSGQELTIEEATLSGVGVRAFMLSSSSTSEQTKEGVFVQSLLRVWKEHASACLTPSDLEREMQSAARTGPFGGFMTPRLAFGRRMTRCIAKLTNPSTLLVFTFSRGSKYPALFSFNDKTDTMFEDDDYFMRQVEVEPVSVRVEVGGQRVFDHEFTLKELDRDVVVTDLPLDDGLAAPSRARHAASLKKLAATMEGYGAEPGTIGEMYYQAALATAESDPEADVDELVDRAAGHAPWRPQYRVAAGSDDPADIGALVTSYGAVGSVAGLDVLGRYDVTAPIWKTLAAKAKAPGEQQFLTFRYMASLKAGAQEEEAVVVGEELLACGGASGTTPGGCARTLTSAQAGLVWAIKESSPEDVRATVAFLPKDPGGWVAPLSYEVEGIRVLGPEGLK